MIRVKVSGIGSDMQGVARLEDGRAVFIPFALPDEEVEIEITKQKDRYAQAKLVRVLSQSPARWEPDCPYYRVCGGCQTRHMSYEKALELKREKVYAALSRLGGLSDPLVLPTIPSPVTDGYRNKAEFACEQGMIGLYREGSSGIVDVDACLLQPERVNRLLQLMKPRLKVPGLCGIVTRVNGCGEIMLILCAKHKSRELETLAEEMLSLESAVKSVYVCVMNVHPVHALDGNCLRLAGAERLSETLCGLHFSISPKSFFQVNRPQAERLYETALAFAGFDPDDAICDLYCGTGTITLCAARHCRSAVGIELVPDAISDARKNAAKNGLSDKVQFTCADAAKAYPPLSRSQRFSAVLVDPPRKGLDRAVAQALIDAPTPKLIYISCDPATLARDVKLLTGSGKYNFIQAQPVDMFPGTSHVETVVLMSKKDT